MKKRVKQIALIALSLQIAYTSYAQQKANDVTAPLHLLKPAYPTPYGAPSVDSVKQVLEKVYNYLNAVTPAQFVDRSTGNTVNDFTKVDTNMALKAADFRLTSYEWGVTYSG